MAGQYRIALSASKDLDQISQYFLSQNVEAGDRLFQEFNRKCRNLVEFPNLGRSYEEILPSLRGIPLNGYIIFYEVIGDDVTILRIVSGRQNLQELFGDE